MNSVFKQTEEPDFSIKLEKDVSFASNNIDDDNNLIPKEEDSKPIIISESFLKRDGAERQNSNVLQEQIMKMK